MQRLIPIWRELWPRLDSECVVICLMNVVCEVVGIGEASVDVKMVDDKSRKKERSDERAMLFKVVLGIRCYTPSSRIVLPPTFTVSTIQQGPNLDLAPIDT